MKLKINEAISALGWFRLINLSEKDRKDFVSEVTQEDGFEGDFFNSDLNQEILALIKLELEGLKIEYLKKELEKVWTVSLTIEGTPKKLFSCPCCKYRTLPERGEYTICKNCFWEDDGSTDPEKWSACNHMYLKTARANFDKFGACNMESITLVDKDGNNKFYKTG